jgi:hypothetical protein
VESANFVPVSGVVHLSTTLGVFLMVEERQFFIPADCLSHSSRQLAVGQTTTLAIVRSFAEREGLIQEAT